MIKKSWISGYMASSEQSWVCTSHWISDIVPGTVSGTYERKKEQSLSHHGKNKSPSPSAPLDNNHRRGRKEASELPTRKEKAIAELLQELPLETKTHEEQIVNLATIWWVIPITMITMCILLMMLLMRTNHSREERQHILMVVMPRNTNPFTTKTRTMLAVEHVRSNGRHKMLRRLRSRVVGICMTSRTVSVIVVPRELEELVTVLDSVSETVVSRLFWVSAVGSKTNSSGSSF